MKVIANPAAGRGKGRVHVRAFRELLSRRGLYCEVLETRRPGEATEIARSLAEAGEPYVVSLGGDGTLSEVANGLVHSRSTLGVVSVGTGNDFARSLALPYNDLAAALEVILEGREREIDVGVDGERCFLSVLGVGFPVTVAEEANRMRRLRGSLAFFAAVYKTVCKLRSHPLQLRMDVGTIQRDCTAVLVQNTPYCGGGLRMAPKARLDDQLLDVVVVGDLGKIDLMVNFPRLYRGSHLNHPQFNLYRCSSVEITSDRPLRKMFDGEVLGKLPARVAVLPRAIKVMAPS